MNRRQFVNKLTTGAAATGAAATAVALTMKDGAQAVTDSEAGQRVQAEVKRLGKRVRELENSHRRLTKFAIFAFGISTGIDAIAWIKGDIF